MPRRSERSLASGALHKLYLIVSGEPTSRRTTKCQHRAALCSPSHTNTRRLAWHHHVTMVMLAMLFIAQQRAADNPGLALLSPRDIVEMLKETLPRKPEGKEALVRRIIQRHQRRHDAIQSRFRTAQKAQPP